MTTAATAALARQHKFKNFVQHRARGAWRYRLHLQANTALITTHSALCAMHPKTSRNQEKRRGIKSRVYKPRPSTSVRPPGDGAVHRYEHVFFVSCIPVCPSRSLSSSVHSYVRTRGVFASLEGIMTTTATAQMDIARRAPDEHSERAHRHDTFDLEYLSRWDGGWVGERSVAAPLPASQLRPQGCQGLSAKTHERLCVARV